MSDPSPAATGLIVVAENVADWRGSDVLDLDGQKLGKLEDVFYDAETDVPVFVSVKSGTFGKRSTLMPLTGASVGPKFLRVDYTKQDLKDAPSYSPEMELSVDEEAEAYKFFSMEYATAGHGARRLARR